MITISLVNFQVAGDSVDLLKVTKLVGILLINRLILKILWQKDIDNHGVNHVSIRLPE